MISQNILNKVEVDVITLMPSNDLDGSGRECNEFCFNSGRHRGGVQKLVQLGTYIIHENIVLSSPHNYMSPFYITESSLKPCHIPSIVGRCTGDR
jgi:hypothetical protein